MTQCVALLRAKIGDLQDKLKAARGLAALYEGRERRANRTLAGAAIDDDSVAGRLDRVEERVRFMMSEMAEMKRAALRRIDG